MLNWRFIRQVGPFHWAIRYSMRQFSKRVLRRDNRMILPTGSAILLPRTSPNATEVYVTGADIDWGAEALLARFANPTRDFIDIGAHIGYYSVYMSPLVRKAYAFEPHPDNIEPLKINAAQAGNIEAVNAAVSSKDGTGRLNLRASTAVSSLDREGGQTVEVLMTTIDSFVALRPNIDAAIVKTDIEGRDIHALLGMEKTVRRCQPLVLTESDDGESLAQLCKNWGYSAFAFVRDRHSNRVRLCKLALPEGLQNNWCKMIFLVPEHLRTKFGELSGE